MKLRIKGNSIRLRLLRSEVERFAAGGRISETIRFGTGDSSSLRYSLISMKDAESVTARFYGNEIEVKIPEKIAQEWTSGEEVGFEIQQPIGNGESLDILVEKDFACLDRPDDPDRVDAYANPNAVC